MTLGERLYAAAVATEAHPFHSAGLSWELCSEATKARWEACAIMIDAATRADVVGQIRDCAGNAGTNLGRNAIHMVAERVEAGRT